MDNNRKALIGGGVALLVLAGGFLFLRKQEPEEVSLKGGIYYNGPMRAKGSTTYGTADGKVYSAQEARTAATEFQRNLDGSSSPATQ